MPFTFRRRNQATARHQNITPADKSIITKYQRRFARYLTNTSFQQSKDPEFTLFPFLPTELRLKIWTMAAEEANFPAGQSWLFFQVIEDAIFMEMDSQGSPCCYTLMCRLHPSVLTAVYTRPMRQLAASCYEAAQAIDARFERFEFEIGSIYFDPAKDAIMLMPRNLGNDDDAQAMLAYRPHIITIGNVNAEDEAFLQRAKPLPDCVTRLGLDVSKIGTRDKLLGVATQTYLERLVFFYLLGHSLEELVLWNSNALWANPCGRLGRLFTARYDPAARCWPLLHGAKSVALAARLLTKVRQSKANPAWNAWQRQDWLQELGNIIPCLDFLEMACHRLDQTHIGLYTTPTRFGFVRKNPRRSFYLPAHQSPWNNDVSV